MQTLSTKKLKEMKEQQTDFLLVNTLSEENFTAAHIPDSVNVPQQDSAFVSRVEQMAGGKEKPVVVYCASEQCQSSPEAAKKLDEAGFTNVYDYLGGAKAWQEAGEPLVAGT